MIKRCTGCAKEIEDEEYIVYELDCQELRYFCNDKKCQKRIDEKIYTHNYEWVLTIKNGRELFIDEMEHRGPGNLYRISYIGRFSRVSLYSDKYIWETGNVLRVLDEQPEHNPGTIHIDKDRTRKR